MRRGPIGEVFDSVLAAAQTGAEWAFAALYEEFNPRLVRYFVARAPAEADDLAAETWLGAASRLTLFRGTESEFRSWLFTIAHRRLSDHWAQMKRCRAEPAESSWMEDHPAVDDPERSAVDALSAQAAARRIAAALNPDQAEVVLLRLLGGLDVDQVATVMGKRPGTVRVLQHRALRRLAKEFSLEDVTG